MTHSRQRISARLYRDERPVPLENVPDECPHCHQWRGGTWEIVELGKCEVELSCFNCGSTVRVRRPESMAGRAVHPRSNRGEE